MKKFLALLLIVCVLVTSVFSGSVFALDDDVDMDFGMDDEQPEVPEGPELPEGTLFYEDFENISDPTTVITDAANQSWANPKTLHYRFCFGKQKYKSLCYVAKFICSYR